jgi:hypothetical protein
LYIWPLLLQTVNSSTPDLTAVGVGALLAVKVFETVLPYIKGDKDKRDRSGDKPSEFWILRFDEAVSKGNAPQITVLQEIRDDIRELVIIQRQGKGRGTGAGQ